MHCNRFSSSRGKSQRNSEKKEREEEIKDSDLIFPSNAICLPEISVYF